jgi:N-acetylglucosamine kinase-like BadF-type ATPase
VAERFGLHDDFAQGVIAAVHAREPAHLGQLAPLVTRAAAQGDAVAVTLVDDAAARLVAAVHAVRRGESELVLAGGLLLADDPLRRAVLARLPELAVRDAGPGAAGAAALALADVGGDPEALVRVRAGTPR